MLLGVLLSSCGVTEEVVAVSLDEATEIFYCEGRADRTYHFDKSCKALKNCSDQRQITKEDVRKHGLNPCHICAK